MSYGSFLEYLAGEAGCDCLSDLRLQRERWQEKILKILKNTSAEKYNLAEWREVISYVSDTDRKVLESITTPQGAKEYIIHWLEK